MLNNEFPELTSSTMRIQLYEFQLVLQLPEGCPIEDMGYEDDIALALGNPQDDTSQPHFMDGHS
jgi:hypothetical protein